MLKPRKKTKEVTVYRSTGDRQQGVFALVEGFQRVSPVVQDLLLIFPLRDLLLPPTIQLSNTSPPSPR
jgi:hypothetical protein